MTKKLIIVFLIVKLSLVTCFTFSQNGAAINTTGVASDPSAILDVSSTNAGILIPRMTESQKAAIQSPATGLMIYQTDGTSGFWYFDGIIWKQSLGVTGPAGPTGVDGATGFLQSGNAPGNTPYWDGTNWVINSSNIFNNGGSVGIATNNPDASAALDISSTNKGLLPPRMNTSQRDLIQSPAEGLVIYNTDTECTEIYRIIDGWYSLCQSGGSDCITLPTQISPSGYYYTGFYQEFTGSGMWWKTKANYPRPRTYLRSVTYNNEIYIFGHKIQSGSSTDNYLVYKYTPSSNLWTSLGSMNTSMNYDRYGVEEVNGKFYFIAGIQSSSCGNANTWEYDPATSTYTQKANSPASFYQHATAVVNNKIYTFGGQGNCCGGCYTNKTYEYDVANNTWATKANMPVSVYGATAAAYNNKIYIFGGSISGSSSTTTVYEYNPSTNSYSQKASMLTARADAYARTYNNKIYVFGGGTKKVEVYDPLTNTWSAGMDMPDTRSGFGGGVVNNKIYIIGGDTYTVYNNTWEYDPVLDTGPLFYMHCKQ